MRKLLALLFALNLCACTALRENGWDTSTEYMKWDESFLNQNADPMYNSYGRDTFGTPRFQPVFNIFKWETGKTIGGSRRDPNP